MYDIKALYEAASVPHAIALLTEHPQARIIAGGSDVLIQIRSGKLAGAELVSIYALDELRGVSLEADGAIRIGSLTSFSHIARDPIIRARIGALAQAVDMVGGPQIRNIGTIGGNTCNGVTSADSASTLLAWDALVELTGPGGGAPAAHWGFLYPRRPGGPAPRRDPDRHPHPPGRLPGLPRLLHQVRHAGGHGYRHHRLLGEREAVRR